jgi:hypothetical protein
MKCPHPRYLRYGDIATKVVEVSRPYQPLKIYWFVGEGGLGKIKLSKHALDYFRDEREDHRSQRLQDFATNPLLLIELFSGRKGTGFEFPRRSSSINI